MMDDLQLHLLRYIVQFHKADQPWQSMAAFDSLENATRLVSQYGCVQNRFEFRVIDRSIADQSGVAAAVVATFGTTRK